MEPAQMKFFYYGVMVAVVFSLIAEFIQKGF